MCTSLSHRRPDRIASPGQHRAPPDPFARDTRDALLPGLRSAVLAVASAVAAGGLALTARGLLGPAPARASVDLLVGAGVLATGALAATVLFVGSLLLLLAQLARAAGRSARAVEDLAARCTPAVVRRVVAVGLGTGLGLLGPAGLANALEPDLGWVVTSAVQEAPPPEAPAVLGAVTLAPVTSAPAQAAPTSPEPRWSAVSPEPSRSAALPQGPAPAPSAPEPVVVLTGPEVGSPTTTTSVEPARPEAVTVQPGDSLWAIAARGLGSSAPERVAAEWPRWYAENRGTIGDDPDLIRPGQVLEAPTRTGDAS